jgi:molybdenum cofactor cytidylyltransferase
MKPVCIVMAAGVGKRFGANKLLADFAGKPLFRWALDCIDGSCFSAVIVVTGYAPVAAAAEELGFRVVCNDRPEDGVSRTIRLGLQAAGECGGALFMTADQPLLTAETLRKLTERFLEQPQYIYAAAHDGVRGNPCLFPQALFPELLALEGDTGGARVIKAHPDRLRLIEVPAAELADCDTAKALRDLEQTR